MESTSASGNSIFVGVAIIVIAALLLRTMGLSDDGTPIDIPKPGPVDQEYNAARENALRAWKAMQAIDLRLKGVKAGRDRYSDLFDSYGNIDLDGVDAELATLIRNSVAVYRRAVEHFDNFHRFEEIKEFKELPSLGAHSANVSRQGIDCKSDWKLIEHDLDECSAQDKVVGRHLAEKYKTPFVDEL